jgi:hypothetical protein
MAQQWSKQVQPECNNVHSCITFSSVAD